jgi:hypothetical protein
MVIIKEDMTCNYKDYLLTMHIPWSYLRSDH